LYLGVTVIMKRGFSSYSAPGAGPRSRSVSRPRKKTRKEKESTKLGKITGKVTPSSTTLARSTGPFSGKKFVTFLYENALTTIAGASNVLTATFKPNDMYDYDNSGDAGNKQPLYYDVLLSASGPYKNYKVISWKTTFYFINNTASAVDIFVSPPISGVAELDSLAEADNFPGVSRLRLTKSGGCKDYGELVVTGHVKDVYPAYADDLQLAGGYASSPQTIIYQTVVVRGSDGTTNASVMMSVKHEAYTEMMIVDAIVS